MQSAGPRSGLMASRAKDADGTTGIRGGDNQISGDPVAERGRSLPNLVNDIHTDVDVVL